MRRGRCALTRQNAQLGCDEALAAFAGWATEAAPGHTYPFLTWTSRVEGANRNDCKLLEATLNAVDWTPADGPRLAVCRDNGDDHAFCRDPITARGLEPTSTAADRKPVTPAAAPARAAWSSNAPSRGSTASADYSSAGNSSTAPASRSSSSQQHSSPGAKPTPSPEPKRPTETHS